MYLVLQFPHGLIPSHFVLRARQRSQEAQRRMPPSWCWFSWWASIKGGDGLDHWLFSKWFVIEAVDIESAANFSTSLDGLLLVLLLFVSLSGFVSSVTNEYPLFIYTLCVLLRAKNCSTIVGCSKIPPYWIVPYNIYTILLAITLSLALWLAASKHHGASMEKSERCSPIFPTSQHESEPKMGIE
jgi:hypothetical protein